MGSCVLPVIGFLAVRMENRLGTVYDQISEETAELNTVAQECIAGVRTVKAFAREEYEIKKFSRHNRRFYDLNMKQAKLLADHQPTTLENNKPLKADLQLSGHTHGGQIFPLGYIGFLYDDLVYGEYEENGSKIIVSSGFAGWGFPIRTQGKSEYVIVNIKPNL